MHNFVDAWRGKYDSRKYSKKFYHDCLKKIQNASTSKELSRCVIGLLHWKDGKVVEDSTGTFELEGVKYSLKNPRENTYCANNDKNVIESRDFIKWAQNIIKLTNFDLSQIEALRGNRFPLWTNQAIVIPSFVLHILNPKVYPLYDQHVERAKRTFLAEDLNKDARTLTLENYQSYQAFFKEFVEGVPNKDGLDDIQHIKQVDEALWSFGKFMKKKRR
ncbi:hypothetical protein [Evansella tamaricis]|uniref:Uncharacterized protein n=1 Tax=Evansella tamaricis TaxID=2069301 RepID=A0ABS6JMQ9_9BACI|nr:hypothetical protein [Evansella tamaricis]MBU9714127.1 hypothetical protein [Evansella tamaricis]